MRPTHRGKITAPALAELLKTHFDSASVDGDAASTSYGAIRGLTVRAAGRELSVEVVMNPGVPDDVARETIARYNRFLEDATGYSAKERARRLRKAAAAAE